MKKSNQNIDSISNSTELQLPIENGISYTCDSVEDTEGKVREGNDAQLIVEETGEDSYEILSVFCCSCNVKESLDKYTSENVIYSMRGSVTVERIDNESSIMKFTNLDIIDKK